LGHARHFDARRAVTKVDVAVIVVVMPVVMVVAVIMMVVTFELCITATANCAHYSTSKSLIRISSPPWGINFPPPQSGQGSNLLSISTSFTQS
jgi:hypothetical protein